MKVSAGPRPAERSVALSAGGSPSAVSPSAPAALPPPLPAEAAPPAY